MKNQQSYKKKKKVLQACIYIERNISQVKYFVEHQV